MSYSRKLNELYGPLWSDLWSIDQLWFGKTVGQLVAARSTSTILEVLSLRVFIERRA